MFSSSLLRYALVDFGLAQKVPTPKRKTRITAGKEDTPIKITVVSITLGGGGTGQFKLIKLVFIKGTITTVRYIYISVLVLNTL